MAGTKEIKRRIKSIKNTKKITKAMELVAASKMKRAVSKTLASRLYAEYSWELLNSIAKNVDKIPHPFFEEKVEGKNLIVLITSNRGLCGSYNAQVVKKTIFHLKNLHSEDTDIVSIGKKGNIAMQRIGQNVVSAFNDIPDSISLSDIIPLVKYLIGEFKAGTYKKIFIVYTDFISALTQKANLKQILPISKESLKEFIESVGENKGNEQLTTSKVEYLFEGNQTELISSLAEKLVRMQIYQMLLESNASEQSSRMIAMKNASEASGEMIEDLTLMFNKARQSNITREISEISAGMASVN